MPLAPLPIDEFLPQILRALRDGNGNLVLVAEPGAGKTTRVPPAILPLLEGGPHRNAVMLQPRRVAARAAAQRIADERGWRLGGEVGYHVRFDRVIGRDTRLRVLTEGILTRQLLDDAYLDGVGCVVLDEFHERSIHVDLAIALLREVQQTVRPDLKIVVMSATLSAEPVAAFLGGAPVVRVPGRTFPIEVEHRAVARDRWIEDHVVDALAREVGAPRDSGDVLVFLPGVGEINRSVEAASDLAREHDLAMFPLHGSLTGDEQFAALRPAKRRKVIFATNIAETSLTIDGVTTVIDSGLHRMAGYDARRGMDTLTLARVSRASAEQRAGRAGRTRPGRCVRLWSAKEHAELAAFDPPEIARVDLAATVLALHAWGADDPRRFGFFQPPPEQMLASAERLLAMLGALENGKITPLGRTMLAFPAHPRLARLLLAAADWGMPDQGAAVAAMLSEKDFVIEDRPASPTRRSDSDVLDRLEMLESRGRGDWEIDRPALRQVQRAKEQLSFSLSRYSGKGQGEESFSVPKSPAQAIGPSPPPPGVTGEGVMKLILLAYPDRVCRLRDRARRTGTMVGGGGVRLAAESAVVDADFFVAVDARHNPSAARAESLVRIASKVEPAWLGAMFPHLVRREKQAEFDEQRQRVVGVSRAYFVDLLLDEQPNLAVDDETAARVLAEHLAPRAAELIGRDERAANLLARIDLLRRAMPEHPWPAFEGQDLRAILADACRGKRSADQVTGGAIASAIESRLAFPLDRLLDQQAPEAIEVPTGNRIRVRYSPDQPPVLAVRLQELFGLPQTPRVAGGRVAVKLELLGPNYRPVQVTDDLASFWKNTYPQVRKDLRARYPKHSWPEDPLTAPPQAKGGRRKV